MGTVRQPGSQPSPPCQTLWAKRAQCFVSAVAYFWSTSGALPGAGRSEGGVPRTTSTVYRVQSPGNLGQQGGERTSEAICPVWSSRVHSRIRPVPLRARRAGARSTSDLWHVQTLPKFDSILFAAQCPIGREK